MRIIKHLLTGLTTLAAASSFMGCGPEVGPGTQLVGQRCFATSECASGLVCSPERVCAPAPVRAPGNTTNNSSNNASNSTTNNSSNSAVNNVATNNTATNNDQPNNTGANSTPTCPPGTVYFQGTDRLAAGCYTDCSDGGLMCAPDERCAELTNGDQICVPFDQPNNVSPNNEPFCPDGERYCTTEFEYNLCVDRGDGSFDYIERVCPEGTICEDGFCQEFCEDFDGDGAFNNCEPFDCNDRNFNVSPFTEEICGDGRDNNCDGVADEGCEQECCEGGCGANAFCNDCACQPYDQFECQYQNQPCSNFDSFSNDFYCLTQDGLEGRCIGLCDLNTFNPDASCPEPNQRCVFEDFDSGFGLCFDGCDLGDDCGSPSDGCFLFSDDTSMSDGICVPSTRDIPIGGVCEEDVDGIFGCADGGICVNVDAQGGPATCQNSCRPFDNPMGTDCPMDSACLAFDANFGICVKDNGLREGDSCTDLYTACGEDSVMCYPFIGNAGRCQRTCRLSFGNTDCGGTGRCVQPPQSDGGVGVCRAMDP